jgi:hypothetical protein
MSSNATIVPALDLSDRVSCSEAAHLLGMPPEVLRAWSSRLSFPSALGEGADASYRRDEIDVLRTTLATSHSVQGAVREARRRLERAR